MTLALGLMSGTSADGVSLALADFKGKKFKVLKHANYSYPAALAKKILTASHLKTPGLSRLNMELGHHFADCAQKFLKAARVSSSKIAVIGSHGQTVWHGPDDAPRHTLQIGEPSVIAEKTGIPVVADFRTRDVAAGGEGAPLIPYFDWFFWSGKKPRALQNIGGIGNVTYVSKNPGDVLAFDTGPGNCLIDWAVRRVTKNRQAYDAGGRIASRGGISMRAAEAMIKHPYFKRKPPKSTGRELFNERFIPKALLKDTPENLVATLTWFTAQSIADSYKRFLPKMPGEVIVSGGGTLNPVLMRHLTKLLRPARVRSIADYGIETQAKEPAAFAFFALRALQGKTNHLPATTGAKRACILGKILPI